VSAAELARESGVASYFDEMSRCDRAAREPLGCADLAGYLSCVLEQEHSSSSSLGRDVEAAEAAMRLAGFPEAALSTDAKMGPWRIAVLLDRAEGGWPHTHGGVVCLPRSLAAGPRSEARVRTLVHERVHVFQRRHPELARRLYSERWGMRRIPRDAVLGDSSAGRERRRSNPDLDRFLYPLGSDATVRVLLFPSEQAARAGGLAAAVSHALDVETGEVVAVDKEEGKEDTMMPYEHPNEAMAYLMADMAVPSDGVHGEGGSTALVAGIRRWIADVDGAAHVV
jgi:hypothetical protein